MLRRLLFCLPPELAHKVTLEGLRILHALQLSKFLQFTWDAPCTVMGLQFKNPLGLAAGVDKNGEYIDALASLGFGFIEVGTVTPKPQLGNPKPRLFRLITDEALINRLGFNNKGLDYLVNRLQRTRYRGILGINIGKNRDTPLEEAINDYVTGFKRVAPYASYVTVNISSPNTQQLRDLQHGNLLINLLRALKKEQSMQKKYVPLVVKISPDLSLEEIANMASIFLQEKIDGVIATNTTIDRASIAQSDYANETGGLSGKPLRQKADEVLRLLLYRLAPHIPVIGCGGIMDRKGAEEKLALGANLIQVYTGLIYRGVTTFQNRQSSHLFP